MALDLSYEEYIRQRLAPRPGDEFYIHLSDLRRALDQLTPYDVQSVLDFGCGGSPYRSLFRGRYDRADIEQNPDRDITLSSGSQLPSDIDQYDLVISTQVLEHVDRPEQYISECMRALKPDGALVLTTHGLFEDHPCPHDYWRWTAEGLRMLLSRSGFEVEKQYKITCGARAALFFLERDLGGFGPARRVGEIYPSLLGLVRRLGRRRLHEFADRRLIEEAVRDADSAVSTQRYVALGIRARRAPKVKNNASR